MGDVLIKFINKISKNIFETSFQNHYKIINDDHKPQPTSQMISPPYGHMYTFYHLFMNMMPKNDNQKDNFSMFLRGLTLKI